MSRLEELRKKEAELEQERINWLEADNNRMAKKKEQELYKIRNMIEVVVLEEKIEIKRQLEIYKKYIKNLGLEEKFNAFYNKEILKEDKDE